ncbi:MAG: ABC transporter ATP-binding protein/permease [Actinomycetota bacterium]|nr:ABC transporter ATP-binding protein/permease [Actinomycetota bacterium]
MAGWRIKRERPENLRKSVPGLRRILPHFRPYIGKHKALAGGSFAALFAEVGFRLLEPWPLAFILDRVIVTDASGGGSGIGFIDALSPMDLLLFCAIAVVVVISMRALCAYISTIGFAIIGNRVLAEVRGDLYKHLQRLSLSFHTKARGGDLTVRMITDVGQMRDAVVTSLMPFLGNFLVLFGMLAVMLILNWQLAMIALVILPLFYLSTVRLSKQIVGVSRRTKKRQGDMAATAAEAIGAIKLVQALSLEGRFNDAFGGQNQKSMTEDVQAKRLATRMERTADVLIAVSTALVLFFGARLVLSGGLSPGDLVVFITYLKNAFRPIKDFAKYTGRIAKATAAGERIVDILERESDIKDSPDAKPAPALDGSVRFENVHFSYEPDQKVLSGMDFEVGAGERVALVGPSGNGKSTLTNLLLRLYDPGEGRVLVDGKDIREYTLESLRTQASVVLQDSLLFAASIRENIAYGAEAPTDEEIEAAAKLANIHEYIESLPEGYDTVLSERGASLSGGQRQRISIARAAVREAPILILDEPTVGLDEENEKAVVEALENLAVGRTTFLVSHDLGLASRSDRVMYIGGGGVLESGSHAELMREGGRYAKLYRLQRAEEKGGSRAVVG